MPGESPLSMMRQTDHRLRKPPAAAPRSSRRRRLWPVVATAIILVIVFALGWTWLWYYSASIVDRTLAGWVERENAARRVYSCASQTIGGFPFRIQVRCDDAVAEISSESPPFTVRAKNVIVTAEVWHPTTLVGDIAGPLTLSDSDRPPSLMANWSRAEISVAGLPPDPDSASVALEAPHLDLIGPAAKATTMFKADHADLQGRVIAGSPRNNPVIEAVLHFSAAMAPTLHPLAARPTAGEVDAVLRGFKDLSPKSWAAHFREMQQTGGNVEIKYVRITQADAAIVGAGTLSVNAHGKLDGVIRVAIIGVEHIVPLLGIDRMIGQGLDRLTGTQGAPAQGLEALDRLVPGLGGVVRQSATASVVENLKKMGQSTEIDNKPAIVLPLRFSDGAIYLGMVPLGEVPPLF